MIAMMLPRPRHSRGPAPYHDTGAGIQSRGKILFLPRFTKG